MYLATYTKGVFDVWSLIPHFKHLFFKQSDVLRLPDIRIGTTIFTPECLSVVQLCTAALRVGVLYVRPRKGCEHSTLCLDEIAKDVRHYLGVDRIYTG